MPRARAPGVVTHSVKTGDVEGRTSFRFIRGNRQIEVCGFAYYTSEYVLAALPEGHTDDSRYALKRVLSGEIYRHAYCALCPEKMNCDQLQYAENYIFMGFPDTIIKEQVPVARIIHKINVGHAFNPEYARCLVKRVNK